MNVQVHNEWSRGDGCLSDTELFEDFTHLGLHPKTYSDVFNRIVLIFKYQLAHYLNAQVHNAWSRGDGCLSDTVLFEDFTHLGLHPKTYYDVFNRIVLIFKYQLAPFWLKIFIFDLIMI